MHQDQFQPCRGLFFRGDASEALGSDCVRGSEGVPPLLKRLSLTSESLLSSFPSGGLEGGDTLGPILVRFKGARSTSGVEQDGRAALLGWRGWSLFFYPLLVGSGLLGRSPRPPAPS